MRETLHGKECTCVVIFYALEDCLQAMSVLGHNDFIFRHEWEVTNNIRSCNWTLLLFCSPFIIYIKQPIFLWPPLGRTGFREILLWGCFCNRGTSASSASKTLSTHPGSNLQFPLMNRQHWVDKSRVHYPECAWVLFVPKASNSFPNPVIRVFAPSVLILVVLMKSLGRAISRQSSIYSW